MSDNQVAEARTAASQATFRVTSQDVPVKVSAGNLGAGDTVDILEKRGATFETSGVQITATNPSRLLQGPGIYQLSKGVTVNTVSLHIDGSVRPIDYTDDV